MSETRFTPGPWKPFVMTHAERGDLLTPEELGEYVKNSVIKSAEESGTNEFVFVSVEKASGPADVCHVGNGPTRQANARLIAAAPALYAALAHLVQLLETQEHDGGLNVPGLATLNEARAALSQARGDTR